VVEEVAHRGNADVENRVRARADSDGDRLLGDPFEMVAAGVNHVYEQVRIEVERGVDVGGIRLAGVDREGDAAVSRRGALVGELVVVGAARAEAVGDVEHRPVPAPEHERVERQRPRRLSKRTGSRHARLAEVQTGGGPRSSHEPNGSAHRRHERGPVGRRQPSVFQAVRRRHRLVERQAGRGLLRDGIAQMRVGVDERRQHDIRRLRLRLLDGLDLSVLDEDAAADRLERFSEQYGSRYLLHTAFPNRTTICVTTAETRATGAFGRRRAEILRLPTTTYRRPIRSGPRLSRPTKKYTVLSNSY
jgi:hypothetical protein